MSQPSREEVEAFIAALNYGMKVSHKPEFLIALAQGWLENQRPRTDECDHSFEPTSTFWKQCRKCGLEERR